MSDLPQTLEQKRIAEREEALSLIKGSAAAQKDNLERYWYAAPLSQEEYRIVNKAVAESPEPDKEAYRLTAAMLYSRELNLPVSHIMQNFDTYNEYWTGRKFVPDQTFVESVYKSFQIGMKSREQARIARDWMLSGGNDKKMESQIDALSIEMAGLQEYMPRPWYQQMWKDAAQTLPVTATILASGAIATKLTVGALATGGLLAPAAIAKWAAFAGTVARFTTSTSEIAPMEYYQMRKDGVDHNTAIQFAGISGVAQAAVETLLGTAAGAAGKLGASSIPTITAAITKKLFSGGKLGALAKNLVGYVGEAFEEGLEEMIQELISAGVQATANVRAETGLPLPDSREVLQQSWEAAAAGFRSSLVLGVGSGVGGYIQDSRKLVGLKKDAARIPSAEAFIRMKMDEKPDGMTDEQWKAILKEIHEKNYKVDQESEAAIEQAGQEIDADGIKVDEDGEVEVSDGKPTVERRKADGTLHAQQSPIVNTQADGSVQTQMLYGDPVTGSRYGYIQYSQTTDGVIEIENIRVRDGYQNLRKEMMQDFIKQNPDAQITWEPKVESLKAIRDELVVENPRGEKAGLTYWTKAEPMEDQTASAKLMQQMKKQMPNLSSAERVAGLEIIKLAAKQEGLTADQWISKSFMPEAIRPASELEKTEGVSFQGKRGAVRLQQGAKAIIYAAENADFSTFAHEVAHVFRQTMNADLQAKAAEAFGVTDGVWTKEKEEAFAVGFEEYLRSGKAESEAKRTLFQRIAAWLQEIYQKVASNIEITPEIKRVYDELLGLTESGLSQAVAETKQNTTADTEIMYQDDIGTDQMEAVRQRYEGTDEWLKAPNGKPSKLNERQWLQVRTEAFKEWFGDWESDPANASKVKDENGEPMVVYHGTDGDFESFNPDLTINIPVPEAIYFSDDIETAERFKKSRRGGNIYAVYLNLEKPITVDAQGRHAYEMTSEIISLMRDKYRNRYSPIDSEYDGVIIKNVRELQGNKTQTTYAVFNPTQIKSVNNQGTWDKNNPSILFQDDTVTPEAEALFSKAIDHFGTTKDVYEAGYILPTGDMLDFSGRYAAEGYTKVKGKYTPVKGDYLKHGRAVDHRQVSEISTTMDDFIESGAIRMDADAGLADMARMPTAKQWETIKYIIQASGTAWVEMKDGKRTATIEADGKPTKALGYIRRFYAGEDFQDTILFQDDLQSTEVVVDSLVLEGEIDGKNKRARPSEARSPGHNRTIEEAIAQAATLRAEALREQSIVSISDAQRWLREHGYDAVYTRINDDSLVGSPARRIKALFKDQKFLELSKWDQIRIAAQLERPLRSRDYSAQPSAPTQNSKNKGDQAGYKAQANSKQEDSGIVSFDTTVGCDQYCYACYGLKGAGQASVSHQHVVRRPLEGYLKTGQTLRLGEKGDPARDWNWATQQVKEHIDRSINKGQVVSFNDSVYAITKLQYLDGYDSSVIPNLQVSLDPFYPDHMRRTMKNLVLLKAAHPDANVSVRVRTFFSKNQDLNEALQAAIEFAREYKYPIIETRMRFTSTISFKLLELDEKKYKRDGNQFKMTDTYLEHERGTDTEKETYLCDEAALGCPGCRNCLKSISNHKYVPLQNQKLASLGVSVGNITLPKDNYDPVGDKGILFQDAYHGTPHSVDKFSTDHIGTGEGAQAYGWGLYFAGEKEVAKYYRGYLSRTNDAKVGSKTVLQLYEEMSRQADRASGEKADRLYERMAFLEDLDITMDFDESVERIDDADTKAWALSLRDKYKPAGNLYKVSIPDNDEYLDWDKPLSQQSKKVRDALLQAGKTYGKNDSDATGSDLYADLVAEHDDKTLPKFMAAPDKAASLYLKSLGIPGIKYFDANSRGNGQGSSNYVIFDGSDVEITEVLFQPDPADIEAAAKKYDTWQAWMRDEEAAADFLGDEVAAPTWLEGDALADWYKDTWERAHNKGQYATQETAATADAETEQKNDQRFADMMKNTESVKKFMRQLADALYVNLEGVTTEEAEWADQATAMRDRIRIEVPISVQMLAQRVAAGRPLSPAMLKTITTNMKNNTRGYRALYAELTGDQSLAPTGNVFADIKIDEPTMQRWETMSFEDRNRYIRKIKNEEIRRKIATGKIKLDGDIENYLDAIREDEKRLEKKVASLEEEVKEEASRLKMAEKEMLRAGTELQQAERDLAKAEKQIEEKAGKIQKRDETIQALRDKIADIKAEYGEALTSARTEARVQTLLAKRMAIAETKDEIKSKLAEQKAAKAYREHMIAVAKGIMKPASAATIDFEYIQKISAIQEGLDPHFRRALPNWIKALDIEELQDKWERFPDLMRKIMPKSAMDRLDKKPLNEWTLAELEEVANVVDKLRAEGKAVWAAKKKAKADLAIKIQRQIVDAIIENKGVLREYASESEEDKKNAADPKKRLLAGYLATVGTARKAMMLDGDKKGAAYDALIYQEREAYKKEQDNIARRKSPVEQAMKDLDIKIEDMYKTVTVDNAGPGGKAVKYTHSDLLYVLLAAKEDKSRDAVAFGNLMSLPERQKHLEKQSGSALVAGKAIGYGRLNRIVQAAKSLDKKYLDLAEVIASDFRNEFDRINEVSIREFNIGVQRVGNYVPLHRMEVTGDDLAQAVASDWLNTNGGALPRNSEKGFTKQRIEIGAANQKPVKLDLFGTWSDAVEMQEHFINYAEYARSLNRIFKGRFTSGELRSYIKDKWGKAMLTQLDDYINEVANPHSFRKTSESADMIRKFRGQVAPAYLGWKLSSIFKQVVTSPMPFLSKLNPLELAAASLEMAAKPKAMWEEIASKSAIMAERAMDVNMALLKEQQQKATTNDAARAWKRVQGIGMKGLEWADRWAVAGGWMAMYRKTLAAELKNGTDADQAERLAVRTADDLVSNVQPSGRMADLAPLFKESKGPAGAALQVLTQFQTALNVMWQQMTYDLPVAIKQKHFEEVFGTVASLTLAGLFLGLLEQGLPEDEDEKERFRRMLYYSFAQYADTIPLLGQEANDILYSITTGNRRRPMGETLFPAMAEYSGAIQAVSQQDWEKAIDNFARGVGMSLGAPTSGIREAGRVLEGDWQALHGRRKNP